LYKTLHKYTFGYQLLYIFYSKMRPRLQKGILGTILGHLQLQTPKNNETITSGAPQNDTQNQ
jgi:hypothetical protein